MPSLQSKLINKALKKLVQSSFSPKLNIEKLRFDDFDKPGPMVKKLCSIEQFDKGITRGYLLDPLKRVSGEIILYFHGGAFVCGPSLLHWRTLARICSMTGHKGLMINYSLSPENSYPHALNEMEEAYATLLESYRSEDIVFCGDSAGGGLALSLAMKIRDEGGDLPGKLVLLSPWLDLTMGNPRIQDQRNLDKMLATDGLKEAAELYRGNQDLKHPYISPIYGDLKGLPPSYLLIGTHDLLLPDCRQLRNKADKNSMDLKYEEWEEMFHVWMLNAPYLPEAVEAVDSICAFLLNTAEV